MADWNEIKREYLTSKIGLRALAERHNVSFTTLSRMCARERWTEARKQTEDETTTAIGRRAAQTAASVRNELYTIAGKVLKKIGVVVDGEKPFDLREITGALKDLKIVLDVKSTADVKEQRERIKKLQRETVDQSGPTELSVRFEDSEEEEWAE